MDIRFNHVGVRVKDMDASVRFLKAILGDTMSTIDVSPNLRPDDPDVVIVRTDSGVLLDLMSAGGQAPEDGPDYGLIHYCFGVDDVDAAYAAAIAAGGRERLAPLDVTSPDHPDQAIRLAFVIDPNGDVCEFVQHDWVDRADVLRGMLQERSRSQG